MKHNFWDIILGSQEKVGESKMEAVKVPLPTDPNSLATITDRQMKEIETSTQVTPLFLD